MIQTVEPSPVYNLAQYRSWRTTVQTRKKTASIGERVLARLGVKSAEEIPIKVKKMDGSGNISFHVAVGDLLTDEEGKEMNGVVLPSRRFGTFFVDAMGELLVRRNLEEFLTYLVKIKTTDLDRLAKMQHATFGLTEKNKSFCFIFHVSLLHRIFIDMVGMLTDSGEEGV